MPRLGPTGLPPPARHALPDPTEVPEPTEPGDPAAEDDRPAVEWLVAPTGVPPAPPWQPHREMPVGPAADGEVAMSDPGSGRPTVRDRVAAVLPPSLRTAGVDPGRRGVLALAAVALVAAAVAGVGAWGARPRSEPVRPAVVQEAASSPSAAAGVVVSVAGKVRRPGLVRLPAGSRVADALAAAGGVVPGTDTGTVNLARKLVDGELVVVGVAAPGGAAVGPGEPAAPSAPGPGGPVGALLDLNAATVGQLDALPGVGPVLAQRIVDYRQQHGGFRSVDQLREVDGIGESRYRELKDLVTA